MEVGEKQVRIFYENIFTMFNIYENMLDVRQLVKGVITPPFESPPIESKLSPKEELIIKLFCGNKKPEKRKNYLKKYMKIYFQDKKRKELIFTKSEYSYLQKMANQHNQRVGCFARECIFSYLRKKYIVPNTDVLSKIGIDIRAIGNNINQIAKHTNKLKSLSLFNANKLNKKLAILENRIEKSINNPVELTEVLTNSIENNPYLIYQIELIIYHEKIRQVK